MGWQSKNRLNLPKYIMVSVRLTSLCLEEYHRFMMVHVRLERNGVAPDVQPDGKKTAVMAAVWFKKS